ncbi:MAG: SpoIIE family protein phosphatase [Bdellovibrionales bacterium]|nr:SpoIIE family protein phosphatase [Bdellovibrionales bacterium]
MLKARGFSLSTKFILFAVVLELILICGGLYTAYSYLSNQRISLAKTMLLAQVDLLTKQLELEKNEAPLFHFSELELSNLYSFQIIDESGRVYYDSIVPKRVQRQLVGPHPLLDLAKYSGQNRAIQEFNAPQTNELFFGAFRRSLGQYYVLGAVSHAAVEFDVLKILEKFLVLSILFSGMSFLSIVLFSIRMIRPIRRLTDAARKLSDGNFNVEIVPEGSDEIGVLSHSFAIMAGRVQDLLREEIQKIRIEKEVSSVADIQKTLLPDDSIETERFQLEGYYKSATETGGDYWGYFETPRYLVTYVADATGHGLPSAMLTSAARGCFSSIHRFAVENPQLALMPSQLLRLANEAVLDSAQKELNMTMFVTVYDFELKVMHYANAAHYPAWIIRMIEGLPKIQTLQGAGPRLGENQVFESPEDQSVEFGENDVLFLYTDGVLDCTDQQEAAFGKANLKQTVLQSMTDGQNLKGVRDRLAQTLENFIEGKQLDDDITFAFMKRKAPPTSP